MRNPHRLPPNQEMGREGFGRGAPKVERESLAGALVPPTKEEKMWIDRKRIRREVCIEMAHGCFCDGLACDSSDATPDCDKAGGCDSIGFAMNAVIDALAGEAVGVIRTEKYEEVLRDIAAHTKPAMGNSGTFNEGYAAGQKRLAVKAQEALNELDWRRSP